MSLEVSELDKINKEVKNIEKQLNLKKWMIELYLQFCWHI